MSTVVDAWKEAWELAPNALRGGLLASGLCSAAGVLLRWRKLVWAGFAVPEAATVGTAAALGAETLWPVLGLAGTPPGWLLRGEVMVPLATALAVLWLVPIGRAARRGGERAAAACFLLATTLTVLLVSESPHGTEEVRALATGKTLLFLGDADVSWILYATVPLLALALWQVRAFAATAFDRDHARAAGRPVARLEAAFAAGFLVLVAVLAPRAGAPFVFTYLTIPPAAAERLVARPTSVALASVLLGALGFIVGALASVRWDLPFSTSAAAGALLVAGITACVSALFRTQFVRSSPSG